MVVMLDRRWTNGKTDMVYTLSGFPSITKPKNYFFELDAYRPENSLF